VPSDDDNLGGWGHEYVRSLAGELGQEYGARVLDGADPENASAFADLLDFVHIVVPFHLTHNAEAEAIDLLIEVQRLKFLLTLENIIDQNNYERICLYLIKAADYMADPDDLVVRWKFFFF
jgi:26S proteasome regulatory subunit N1